MPEAGVELITTGKKMLPVGQRFAAAAAPKDMAVGSEEPGAGDFVSRRRA